MLTCEGGFVAQPGILHAGHGMKQVGFFCFHYMFCRVCSCNMNTVAKIGRGLLVFNLLRSSGRVAPPLGNGR